MNIAPSSASHPLRNNILPIFSIYPTLTTPSNDLHRALRNLLKLNNSITSTIQVTETITLILIKFLVVPSCKEDLFHYCRDSPNQGCLNERYKNTDSIFLILLSKQPCSHSQPGMWRFVFILIPRTNVTGTKFSDFRVGTQEWWAWSYFLLDI